MSENVVNTDSPIVTMTPNPSAPIPPVATSPLPTAIVPADVHPVVSAVVNGVYSNTNVAPSNAANVAAGILNTIANEAPAVLQLSRASPRTTAYVGIGIESLAALIALFFPHPRG